MRTIKVKFTRSISKSLIFYLQKEFIETKKIIIHTEIDEEEAIIHLSILSDLYYKIIKSAAVRNPLTHTGSITLSLHESIFLKNCILNSFDYSHDPLTDILMTKLVHSIDRKLPTFNQINDKLYDNNF